MIDLERASLVPRPHPPFNVARRKVGKAIKPQLAHQSPQPFVKYPSLSVRFVMYLLRRLLVACFDISALNTHLRPILVSHVELMDVRQLTKSFLHGNLIYIVIIKVCACWRSLISGFTCDFVVLFLGVSMEPTIPTEQTSGSGLQWWNDWDEVSSLNRDIFLGYSLHESVWKRSF